MSAFRTIETRLIDEPAAPSRTEMDDEGLEDLASSIKVLGVRQALTVKPIDGERFEVIAGHRRLLAARMVGLHEVPCIVETNEDLAEAVQLHENIMREDLHPLDEALKLHGLYERVGRDIEKLAALVRRPEAYLSRRLLLLEGDAEVLAAFRAGAVGLGCVEELNRFVRPEDRSWYLEHAVRGGCTTAQMRTWREQANSRAKLQELEPPSGGNGSPAPLPPAVGTPAPVSMMGYAKPHELSTSTQLRSCFFCRTDHEEWQGYRMFVCRGCADVHLAPQLEKEAELGEQRK